MWANIANFVSKNWIDILLVIVGASAFIIYWVQERRKISEAASLIVLQVEELQTSIAEVGPYISEGKLNDGAFYESQMLFKTDYWDKHKHYFVRKMDSFSFRMFDEFYNCASEILEQQQLMKNLQKNSLFLTQQMLMQSETNYILQILAMCAQNPVDVPTLLKTIEGSLPADASDEQKTAFENLMKRMIASNQNIDPNTFWNTYNQSKANLHSVINQNALTHYIPVQIRITLENALKKYNAIQVIGCEGYRKLKKIANRKF